MSQSGALSKRLAEVQIAVMLLTRLPAGRAPATPPSMGATAWCWPLVGAVVGGIAALVCSAASWAGAPPLLSILLGLGAATLATGGLHEDGLADMADGFGGGQTPARRLEIMRDSRIGSYGVLALIFVFLIKLATLVALSEHGVVPAALVAVGMASRAALPAMLAFLPPARANGLGQAASQVSLLSVCVAAGLGVGGLWLLGWSAGFAGVLALGVTALVISRWSVSRIGGQTGDVLGATQQISEAALLCTFVVVLA